MWSRICSMAFANGRSGRVHVAHIGTTGPSLTLPAIPGPKIGTTSDAVVAESANAVAATSAKPAILATDTKILPQAEFVTMFSLTIGPLSRPRIANQLIGRRRTSCRPNSKIPVVRKISVSVGRRSLRFCGLQGYSSCDDLQYILHNEQQMVRVAWARLKREVFIERPGLVVLSVHQ